MELSESQAPQKITRTMLQSSIDRNTVMAMTGLSEEDLQRIAHLHGGVVPARRVV
ncbi:hypothetical protein JBO38_21450 [Enterobacter asburiae]|nr:hypothetical protein [Enterobacter asburiae]